MFRLEIKNKQNKAKRKTTFEEKVLKACVRLYSIYLIMFSQPGFQKHMLKTV
jgi:hypothetical protein